MTSDLFLHELNSNRTNAQTNSNNNILYANNDINNHINNDLFNDYNHNKNSNKQHNNVAYNGANNYNNNNNFQIGHESNDYGLNLQQQNQFGNKLYKNPKYNFDSKGNIINKDSKNRVR